MPRSDASPAGLTRGSIFLRKRWIAGSSPAMTKVRRPIGTIPERPLATLRSQLSAYQMPVLAALLIAILAALVVPPILFLLEASVADPQRAGEWSLTNFAEVLAGRRFLP